MRQHFDAIFFLIYPLIPLAVVFTAALVLLREPEDRAIPRIPAGEPPWPAVPRWLVVTIAAVFLGLSVALTQLPDEPHWGSLSLFGAWILAGLLILGRLAGQYGPRWILQGHARSLLDAALAGCGIAAIVGAIVGLSKPLWAPLRLLTLGAVQWLLIVLGETVHGPTADYVLGTPEYLVEINLRCSGFEGMAIVAMVLGLYGWYRREELWLIQYTLLAFFALALAWVLNVLRITAMIELGAHVSAELATQGFHTFIGAALNTCLALVLIAWAQSSAIFSKPASREFTLIQNPTARYLVPFLGVAGTLLLVRAFSLGGMVVLYPLPVIVGLSLLRYVQLGRLPLNWGFSLTAVGGGIAVFLLWLALIPSPPVGDPSLQLGAALKALPRWAAAAWLVFRVLGSVVVVPLVEELAFRGYLLRRLIAADFDALAWRHYQLLAFVLSSAAFGVLHRHMLAGTLAGMVYAGVMHRRNSLGEAVLAHALTNALLCVYVLGFGRWDLW